MKITIESTSKLVEFQTRHGMAPARVWEGHTDSGIPVHCYIMRVSVNQTADTEQFERELRVCRTPSPEISAIPMRLIL